ncbi:helix-turn-helix domain-containing protein [Salinibacillus xinjiangensis]|uniref:Helix-turn-helix domain-containing protein n=2 Tax=Salinibacillus xinjiangensis TaxID=1229268 RepID=A0A6G1X5C6_9BACI|nr:helix-turn-helix domain-containing protein [Salinibacillus xinjiangensis]
MIEPEFSLLTLKHNLVSRWTSFIRDFLTSNQDIQPGSNQLFLENSLAQISILILQHGAGSHQNHLSTVGGGDIINDVLQALKQSYQHEWTLDDMAKIARMGKYQFAHLFKEEVGRSPYSWLQLYRLFRSQEPLLKTNYSILSIALEHGFSSVSSYNQLFKKVYGKTPTHFRSLHRYP